MSDKKQELKLLITEGERQIILQSDIEFEVQQSKNVPVVHLADVIYGLILNRCREQKLATLQPGKYRICMTAAIADLNSMSEPEYDVDLSELEGPE